MLFRKEDSSRQMAEIRGEALPCGSNEGQASCRRRMRACQSPYDVTGMLSRRQSKSDHASNQKYRSVKRSCRNPKAIIASFPACTSEVTRHYHTYTSCAPTVASQPQRTLHSPRTPLPSTHHKPRSLVRTTLIAFHLHAILIQSALRCR